MEEESEYKKLPTDEKCVHKLWKARVAGYEEAAKLFKQIYDAKSPEWNKYLGLIKKFVTDSNAVAQEKGLEAALAFIENCGHAGKTVGEVMSGIVTKCIAAPKTKTKDLALQVTLMYVEIEKHEAVQEELIKGMEHKNPRIQSACISAMTSALKLFGNKVIGIKLLVKKIQPILTDRDKDVRTEGKALLVEMHRWIGPALEPHISSLQPVVLQELKDAFSDTGKAIPERYLRSQQVSSPAATAGNDDGGGEDDGNDEEDGGGDADMDPYDLMDPVDVISKLPKDFYEKLEAKKWQERKEALDALEALLKSAPKLEQGDYGDLVRALKRVISKDTNVMLVALAGKSVSLLASGLKKRFGTYSTALIPCVLDKFKEKKPNVVSSLREAMDAMYPCTSIEAIAEDVVEALNNKNPAVKAETAAFLARAFTYTQPAALNKKLMKTYVGALLKVLESADPNVRDQASEALGTAMKLVGEKNVSAFIGQLDKLKEEKIKECMDKAVIMVKVAGPKKEARPKTAPAPKGDSKGGSAQPKSVKRPTTGAPAKAPVKKAAASSKPAAASKAPPTKDISERELSPEEVDERAEELLDPSTWSGLTDANWKIRIEAVEGFKRSISEMSSSEVTAQLLMKILNKKPGLKDNNFQALKMRLEAVKAVAEKFPVSITCVDCILPEIVEKLSDPKCSAAASDALMSLAEASRLEYVANQALEYALEKQKSPRVQSEIFAWLSNALKEFGNVINAKSVLIHVKKALSANNPAVRVSAISFLGVLHMYMGAALNQFIDGEKPAIKTQIQQELEKFAEEEAPAPIRGWSSALKGSMEVLDDNAGGDEEFNDCDDTSPAEPVADVKSRVDISSQITDALIQEINDKNWKVRNEALEKVKTMLVDAQSIKPNIGELPSALAPRLVDSNSKITQLTLQVCEQLAIAIGAKAKQHIRILFPGIFQDLGDLKTWVRSAALQCLNVWTTQCGVHSIFEGEIVFDALKNGGPILRAELWTWLAENLPNATPKSIPKEELAVCVPLLFAALEDRGAEVRKGAGEAVLGFMMHLGIEGMARQAEKLKPGSKNVVQTAIEKAKPNMPIQPLPKAAESKAVKSGGAQAKAQGGQKGQAKPTKGIVKSASSSSARGKKEDEDAFAPLLSINNTKNQRIIDDQKLKVLKWNFLTPREEFFDLLKDQMATAGMNKTLIANMFHADFRYHIKSIESLMDDMAENGQALVCNLDLIFKWLSLRFFDTNPSVLLKGLEYLNSVFIYLINENYHMAEYEAGCFIPYLVLKVGDPKDTVRNGVKALLKQICVVYSVNKLFGYLMDGLKSKNARQRTECLDVMGLLIENYGISICGSQPAVAFKDIARQISDRDNSVRNAALNCVVQAYFLEGEKVYKMIGQISDKDMSLLEERIKRAAKGKDTSNRKSMLVPLNSTGRPIQPEISKPVSQEQQHTPNNECDDYEEEQQIPNYPPPPMSVEKKINSIKEKMLEIKERRLSEGRSKAFDFSSLKRSLDESPSPLEMPKLGRESNIARILPLFKSRLEAVAPGRPQNENRRDQPRPVSGPFRLDPSMMATIEDGLQEDIQAMTRRPVLQEMDLSFLDDPVPHPNPQTHRPQTTNLPLSPSGRAVHPSLPRSSSAMSSHLQTSPQTPRYEQQDNSVTRAIQQIASPNLSLAVSALSQVNSILSSNRANLMAPYEEQLLSAIVEQLQILQRPNQTATSGDLFDAYRFVMTVLTSFYEGKVAGRNVSSGTVASLVDQLLRLLVSRALEKNCTEGEDKLVRVTNVVCVKVLERSDHTSLIIALIHLLDRSVSGDPPSARYQELEMKCLWKVMKLIPTWDSESLDFDRLMFKLHEFFKTYPSSYWKKNTSISDTPFRTIKTMVHTLVKKKGGSIKNHLSMIPDVNHSELLTYLDKLFKSLKIDVNTPGEAPPVVVHHKDESPKRPPRLVQEELSLIVKRIGEKEHSKEALGQLYDFTERNPQVDIWICLKDVSNFFRSYIERGLKEVAEERRMGGGHMPAPITLTHVHQHALSAAYGLNFQSHNMTQDQNEDPSKGHSYYSERLKSLRAKLGLASDTPSNSQSRSPVIDNRTLADTIDDNSKQSNDPKFDLPSLHQTSSRPEPQMDALKQKLQQIKSANR